MWASLSTVLVASQGPHTAGLRPRAAFCGVCCYIDPCLPSACLPASLQDMMEAELAARGPPTQKQLLEAEPLAAAAQLEFSSTVSRP